MSVINQVTNMPIIRPVGCFDKLEIIDIAKKYGNCGMQEKFNSLNKITEINHRRLVNEQKERNLSKYIY